ncbi:MAG: 2-oxoacid:acceptor oxidoreductase subunit alpha [Proteobacteria bacterium]|nr:2-oxoacid:acceptor oxidoreductase subunit alpha [Pseudomonadota bacterium]
MAKKKKRLFLQGNEACIEGAILAGCNFYAGYPITPSTELMELSSAKLPKIGGKFIQMEDEIASMAATIGAAMAGSKAMTATSGPGFSLKQEALGYACMIEAPCVVINVMRSGPSTGYPTGPSQGDVMQAKWGTHGDHPVIALVPASVQELLYETIRAFNLAERFRTPVIILFDEVIGHMREAIDIPDVSEVEIVNRVTPDCDPEDFNPYDLSKSDVPPMAPYGEGYRFHATGLYHAEDGFPTANQAAIHNTNKRLISKVEDNLDEVLKNEELFLEDAEVGVFAYGVSAKSAKFAVKELRKQGVKAGLLRPLTIWPFPEEAVSKMADQVKKIIVPEMNLGQAVHEVERVVAGRCEVQGIFRVDTEPIHPKQVMQAILGRPVDPLVVPDEVVV